MVPLETYQALVDMGCLVQIVCISIVSPFSEDVADCVDKFFATVHLFLVIIFWFITDYCGCQYTCRSVALVALAMALLGLARMAWT